MIFTAEEKSLVQSVRMTPGKTSLERIPCIRAISFLMARAVAPEEKSMMDRVQNKLGRMSDYEFSVYDFSPDEIEET